MRTKILKVVVVLLLSASGNARPQKTEPSIQVQPSKAVPEEWRSSGASLQAVREDSRYTWNSGSSTIPYINRYRDSVDPFVDPDGEVSVDESRKSKSMDFWNSPRSPLLSSRKSADRSNVNSNRQISPIFPEQSIETNDVARFRKVYRRHSTIPLFRDTVSGNVDKNSIRNQRFASGHARVPPLSSRISYRKVVANRSNATKNGPSRDSVRDGSFRRGVGVPMNNSRSSGVTLGQNTKFSGQKQGFPTSFIGVPAKVESTTPFDHVAAIKKITGMLTNEQVAPKLSMENENVVENGVPPITASKRHSNRHSSSKQSNRTSNRTKIRRPVSHQSNKKNQSKINPNKLHGNKGNSSKPDMNLKNWPNGAIQNAEDFHNYDKYTSMVDHSRPDESVQQPAPLKNSSFNHQLPISSPSLQEIVHWLKIPAFMTNGSHVVESDQINDPISVAFDPVYQNLEPNKPLNPVDLQNLKPGFIYPLHSSSYTTDKVPGWLQNVPLRNATWKPIVHNPQTQVSQNTVVHLINTDPRKPNRTIVGSKVPAGYTKPIVSGTFVPSSGSSPTSGSGVYPSSLLLSQLLPSSATTSRPGPNVHIGFTSVDENDKLSDQKRPQAPMVTYDQSCPTILINSYTRINNTIQSKEGCTDLNIIINSQVFNTNTYKSTPSPLVDQSNSGVYQNYGEIDKYDPDSSSYQGSNDQPAPIYRPISSRPTQWPQAAYYDPQKDPQSQTLEQNDVSNVEVVQDTQISISGSSSGESSSPIESSFTGVEDSGSINDGPGSSAVVGSDVGQANDPSSGNSLVRPAESPAASNPGSSGSSSSSPGSLIAGSSVPARPTDDDDDDEYDLSPGSIMESIASMFTYFMFVNPLHYGFFSLAAAPFTAVAAGLLGIVTFLYPWLFPSSYGFSRANNNAGDSFWSNLEEAVRKAMEKYGRVNEWKSKRKKRKR